MAAVPLLVAIAYLAPVYLAMASSKRFINSLKWAVPVESRASLTYWYSKLVNLLPEVRIFSLGVYMFSIFKYITIQAMNMKNKGSQGDFRGSISVVVVTYNQEKFLTKSLRSVFDQTRMPDEVIVVDNGSTDATRQIIKEYRGKIFYIRNKKNLGAVRAFNQGLAAASGDYVILLSADDWFGKKILEEEGAVLDRNPNIAVVYSQAYTWHKGGKLTNAKTAGETTIIGRDEFERLLTQGDFIPLLTALIRRSVYQI